ncbi:MAG: Crp/Fnr family transcriptional regulator [Christensenellales bacterium]|jgi:CRP-like cAMP-binding protein
MDVSLIAKTELFRGIDAGHVRAMLECLDARARAYRKGEAIYAVGAMAEAIGLVMSGSVHIESDDVWGNRTIIDVIAPGQVFAEAYACARTSPMMVNVVAAEDCEILLLNVERVLTTCTSACAHHSLLVRNLLSVTAQKNLKLTRRMFHISPRTLRAKLLSYLSDQAILNGRLAFDIPFNRQELADYLGVDRSALSNELSKMRRDGILDCDRNHFTLLRALETNHN